MFGKQALRTTLISGALLGCLASAPAASAATLYDQTTPASGVGVFSQLSLDDPVDVKLADDFVVPLGGWSVANVFVEGLYDGGSGPVPSLNVSFYDNAGTLPVDPATDVYTAVPPISGTAGPDFSINLSPPAVLDDGVHWVSVQANLDGYPDNVWDWEARTMQAGSPAAAKGIAPCALAWDSRTTCLSASGGPDQLFRLSDTPDPGPPAPPPGVGTSPPPVVTPAKKKCKKGKKLKKGKCVKKKKRKK